VSTGDLNRIKGKQTLEKEATYEEEPWELEEIA